jgi:protein-S-isoprenylcysteine O-methyltransferase Ste14
MEPRPNSSFRPYLSSAISLFVLGWGAAALTVSSLTPTVWARWLLFFGGTLGLTGLAMPVTWFLNLRFPSNPPAGSTVIVRQAIWAGVYGALLVWLQQARLVTLWIGLGLAIGLVAIEYLVRMREKARWQPKAVSEKEPPADTNPPSEA